LGAKSLDLRQWLVWQTDIVECAVDVEGGHVFLQVEGVGHVGAVEDEVEGKCPWLGPVLVLSADKLLSAEFEGVFFLVGAVGDGVGLGAEGIGPEKTEVSEPTAVWESEKGTLKGR